MHNRRSSRLIILVAALMLIPLPIDRWIANRGDPSAIGSGSKPWFPVWSRRPNGFEGTVLNDRFNINRAIRYRNSFIPILHDRMSANGSGTRIDVRMIMHPFVIVFLLIWCGIILSAILGIVFDFVRGGQLTHRDWIPLFKLAFVYLLTFSHLVSKRKRPRACSMMSSTNRRPKKALELTPR